MNVKKLGSTPTKSVYILYHPRIDIGLCDHNQKQKPLNVFRKCLEKLPKMGIRTFYDHLDEKHVLPCAIYATFIDGLMPIFYSVEQDRFLFNYHQNYHDKSLPSLLEESVIPILITPYHEASLPFSFVIKKVFPCAKINSYDYHLDAASNNFISASFWNYGIQNKYIVGSDLSIISGTLGYLLDPVDLLKGPIPSDVKEDIENLEEIEDGSIPESFKRHFIKKACEKLLINNVSCPSNNNAVIKYYEQCKRPLAEIGWLLLKDASVYCDVRKVPNFQGEEIIVSFDADYAATLPCYGYTLQDLLDINLQKLAGAKIRGIHICELDSDMNMFGSNQIVEFISKIISNSKS